MSLRKTPGRTRVVIVGGSAAFGYAVSDEQTAAALLPEMMLQAGCEIETINAGVPGYDAELVTLRVVERIAAYQPDVVIVYLGWNDLPSLMSTAAVSRRRPRLGSPLERCLAGRSVLWGLLRYSGGSDGGGFSRAGTAASR
ncbi:MAG: SGNH/GDSL hydrolase family protein [Planctomycetaceae bacterium]